MWAMVFSVRPSNQPSQETPLGLLAPQQPIWHIPSGPCSSRLLLALPHEGGGRFDNGGMPFLGNWPTTYCKIQAPADGSVAFITGEKISIHPAWQWATAPLCSIQPQPWTVPSPSTNTHKNTSHKI
jgi:hypothetical protein